MRAGTPPCDADVILSAVRVSGGDLLRGFAIAFRVSVVLGALVAWEHGNTAFLSITFPNHLDVQSAHCREQCPDLVDSLVLGLGFMAMGADLSAKTRAACHEESIRRMAGPVDTLAYFCASVRDGL